MKKSNHGVSAVTGVILLVAVVICIAASVFIAIEHMRQEELVMDCIDINVVDYSVDGEAVSISFTFNNVSSDISPHLEVRLSKLIISNRTVVGTTSEALQFVNVHLTKGDNTFEHVFEGLIKKETGAFRIDVDFVSRVGMIHLEPLYILDE